MSDYQQIIKQIEKRVFHPVYFLYGEEPFFIDNITKAIEEKVLKEEEKEFNQVVLYGYDTDINELIATLKRFPMMASHMVVILREAQMLKHLEQLQQYVENPMKSTILVICYKYKKLDKRRSFYKTIQKKGVVFESGKVKDYRLPNWISSFVQSEGYKIGEREAILISEHLGNDLSKVSNELGKVFLSLDPGNKITSSIIEQSIGISKDYNLFELQKAIGEKNLEKANRIVFYFSENPKDNPLVMVVAVLYSYFSKLLKMHFLKGRTKQEVASVLGVNPFFVSEYQTAARNYSAKKVIKIIEHLRSCDLKSKGIGNISASQPGLLKELIFKIMH